MRPQDDIEAAARDDRNLASVASKGGAAGDFATAIATARQVCADADLDLYFDKNGEARYTEFQLHKAVRHTREDVSATLLLQMQILRRLDRNRNFMIGIIVLILIIAAQ